MKIKRFIAYLMLLLLSFVQVVPAAIADGAPKAKIEYLTAKPLVDVLKSLVAQPFTADVIPVPTITWAGDISTIFADQTGAFQQEGLKVKLFKEDDFAKQVQDCLNGKTPYVRGTMGMINSAAEAFEKAGDPLVPIYQLTWSSGGDTATVRSGINDLSDLKGKTIALQLYGPHMDFLLTILTKAGLQPSDVHIKWLRNLTVPPTESATINDTVSAFRADPSLNACMVIAPDADALTKGNGADNSVKGAKVLISSAAANRIICDVYAVRSSYLKAHRAEVQKFVHALMVGQERFDSLMANKSANQAAYNELIKRAAVMQYDDALKQSKDNAEGSLGDCTWVGFTGNQQFFTGQGTSRNFAQLNKEIQAEFKPLNLMHGPVTLATANWDYSQLASGLRNVVVIAKPLLTDKQAEKIRANASQEIAKANAKAQQKPAAEPTDWESTGTLYWFEINFQPNQFSFDSDDYTESFKRIYELSQSLGGAVVFVEGHAAPNNTDALKKAIADAKGNQASPAAVGILTQQLSEQQQAARTLGLNRAQKVCEAYARYCKSRGQNIDATQLQPISMGADRPKVKNPVGKEQTLQCMRVVFRLKQVAAEPTFE